MLKTDNLNKFKVTVIFLNSCVSRYETCSPQKANEKTFFFFKLFTFYVILFGTM